MKRTPAQAGPFAAWLKREREDEKSTLLSEQDKVLLANLDTDAWWLAAETAERVREPLLRAAATYFLHARTRRGTPADPVARFHLGNGARLERLNWPGDTSEKAMRQSYGLMVNYLYDLEDIEKNHEAYAGQRVVVASNAVNRLARAPAPARDVPVAVPA